MLSSQVSKRVCLVLAIVCLGREGVLAGEIDRDSGMPAIRPHRAGREAGSKSVTLPQLSVAAEREVHWDPHICVGCGGEAFGSRVRADHAMPRIDVRHRSKHRNALDAAT